MTLVPYKARLFRETDTRPLMALFYETIHTVNTADYTPEQIQAWAPDAPAQMNQQVWLARLASKYTLVAETETELLIGFANLEPMEGSENGGHIDQFFCHKDFQGAGVGTMLYKGLEEEARRQGMTRLFVEASITAHPFFERRGFRVLTQQTVERFGVDLTNFRMEKPLGDTSAT